MAGQEICRNRIPVLHILARLYTRQPYVYPRKQKNVCFPMRAIEKRLYQAPSAEVKEVYRYTPGNIQTLEKGPAEYLFLTDPDAMVYPVQAEKSPGGRTVFLAGSFPSGVYRIFGGDVPYFCTPSSGRISALCPAEQMQEGENFPFSDRSGLLWVGTSPVTVSEKRIIPQSIALIPANALLEIPVRNIGVVPLTIYSVGMEQMSGREIPSVLSLERDGAVSVGIESALAECSSVRVSLVPPVVIDPGCCCVVRMLVTPFETGPSRFTVNTAEKGDLIFYKSRGMRFLSGHSHRVTGIEIKE